MTATLARRSAARAIAGVCVLAGILVGCAALTLNGGPGGQTAYACDVKDPSCEPTGGPTISATGTTTIAGDPGGGGGAVCQFEGQEIPCETEDGVWYAGRACYISTVPPSLWPPAGDAIYGGADPQTAEGGVYWCTRPGWIGLPEMFWLDGPAPVDPRVVVIEAAKALPLEHATALVAPGPDFHTYIHVDNWMWVPEDQWHTTQVTVTAGPISVTAVGEPVRVEWDMGTETVICYNAGRPWIKGMTDAAKTTCSYAYETLEDPKGDAHDVSARIVYDVTWTCAGPCLIQAGALGEYTAPAGETTTIEVRQRQTVVTN